MIRRLAYEALKFAIYVGTGLIALFPYVPEPQGFRDFLILIAALSAICVAVNKTVDWVRDTIVDITERRRRERDERD